MQTFAQALKMLRKQLHPNPKKSISQDEAAKRCGFSQAFWSQLERRERRPGEDVMVKIQQTFGFTMILDEQGFRFEPSQGQKTKPAEQTEIDQKEIDKNFSMTARWTASDSMVEPNPFGFP